MTRVARLPRELTFIPFRGSEVVARGLLTRDMLRGRSWRRLFRDVYVHASAYQAEDHRMWCDAIALTLQPGEAVDGLSAAFLWGVNILPRNAPVSISVRRAVHLWPRTYTTCTRTTVDRSDIAELSGIPVTTPLRTAFDLGRRLSRTESVVALDALTHRRIVRLDQLSDYAKTRFRWPGARQLRDVIMLAEPLSESPMETRLRLLLLDAGAPELTPQHEIRDPHGRFIARADLAYPQWQIAIEYEGDHHREKGQFRRDVARLNALRAAGWIVLRFTADDVLRHPNRIVEQVATAIRERR